MPRSGPTTPDAHAAPLFIVGCGRSGTTLLRLMLHAHPDMSIPQESHFIYKLARERARGAWPTHPTADADWHRLLAYLADSPYLNKWQIDRSRLRADLAGVETRTYGAAFRAVFESFRTQHGAGRWGDKTPQHVQYMLLLDHLFPDARFVHVVRDGRDVARSLMGRPWGPRHMRLAGHYWAWLVLSGIVAGHLLGPERYREVKYEDLVMEPEATLRSVCSWADLPFTDAMLDYHATKAAKDYAQGGKVAKRLAKPPDARRVQRWREDMDPGDEASIRRQAGALLALLDYPVDELPPAQATQLDRLRELLHGPMLERLSQQVTPWPGTDVRRLGGLYLDRALQTATLLAGQPAAWSRSSIRWQRTMNTLLQ